ncbi:hypothetical protein PtB15_12B129 [Puccinia triticina]|nr:hypothetical protein PtB15_12B129 [Puccinia triticina]
MKCLKPDAAIFVTLVKVTTTTRQALNPSPSNTPEIEKNNEETTDKEKQCLD